MGRRRDDWKGQGDGPEMMGGMAVDTIRNRYPVRKGCRKGGRAIHPKAFLGTKEGIMSYCDINLAYNAQLRAAR